VDIGSSSIKLVALRETKGVYHLANIGVAPLPPEAIVDNSVMDAMAVVGALTTLLDSLKLKACDAVTSVSGHSVIIRKIQLPLMSEDELESQLIFEAEQYIPFDISEVNIDFQILGPNAKDPSQMDVVLVAAKKDFVADYQALFQDAGLNLKVLDIDCFAIENAYEVNYGYVENEIVALVDIGASSTKINIMRGQELMFTRDVQVGGNTINEELQKRLGVSGDQAEFLKLGGTLDDIDGDVVSQVISEAANGLAQDIQRSLDFFSATAGEEKVAKACLSGGLARLLEVRQSLESRLRIPLEVADPFQGLAIDEKQFDPEYLSTVAPMFSVAVGLATRRVGDK